MIPYWILFSWNSTGIPGACLFVLFIASIALIRFNDRYSNREARARESSINELEALFALQDDRERRRFRSLGKR